MATVEDRLTVIETEFRTELKHLATKADLKSMEMRLTVQLGGLMIAGFGVVVAVVKLWQ